MILELCKGVHCVDLGESFQTHIYLQNLASIQPRTSPLKFARPLGAGLDPHSQDVLFDFQHDGKKLDAFPEERERLREQKLPRGPRCY